MYSIKKIENSESIITLDGRLDKTIWQEVEKVNLVDTVTGEKPKQETYVKMCYDSEHLYVGFYCYDDEIRAELTNYNDLIYNEEVVEVFIDDDCDLHTYTELEVSPLNTLLHYTIRNDLKGKPMGAARVNKVIDTAVLRDDEAGFWSVEMKIPFREVTFKEPTKGTEWLINLYRIDRRENGEDEYQAWGATGLVNYHQPKAFKKVVFA